MLNIEIEDVCHFLMIGKRIGTKLYVRTASGYWVELKTLIERGCDHGDVSGTI